MLHAPLTCNELNSVSEISAAVRALPSTSMISEMLPLKYGLFQFDRPKNAFFRCSRFGVHPLLPPPVDASHAPLPAAHGCSSPSTYTCIVPLSSTVPHICIQVLTLRMSRIARYFDEPSRRMYQTKVPEVVLAWNPILLLLAPLAMSANRSQAVMVDHLVQAQSEKAPPPTVIPPLIDMCCPSFGVAPTPSNTNALVAPPSSASLPGPNDAPLWIVAVNCPLFAPVDTTAVLLPSLKPSRGNVHVCRGASERAVVAGTVVVATA